MQYGAPQFAAVPNYAPLQRASTNSYTMQTQVYIRYIIYYIYIYIMYMYIYMYIYIRRWRSSIYMQMAYQQPPTSKRSQHTSQALYY